MKARAVCPESHKLGAFVHHVSSPCLRKSPGVYLRTGSRAIIISEPVDRVSHPSNLAITCTELALGVVFLHYRSALSCPNPLMVFSVPALSSSVANKSEIWDGFAFKLLCMRDKSRVRKGCMMSISWFFFLFNQLS